MNTKIFRVAIVSGLIAVVGILLAVSVSSSDTSQPQANASNVEKVSPAPGGILRPQSEVSFDLTDGYTGRLYIDSEIVPEDQLEIVLSLGQFTFRPGKGQIVEQFDAGSHSAQIFYWEADKPEPAQPQTYSWDFKVTS
jgi:hypothetical protein